MSISSSFSIMEAFNQLECKNTFYFLWITTSRDFI
ncbi:Uncharacterised protein [Acinetobacter baumannii]|nr:Uncharacterised protein [Acinetobacter baumannii]